MAARLPDLPLDVLGLLLLFLPLHAHARRGACAGALSLRASCRALRSGCAATTGAHGPAVWPGLLFGKQRSANDGLDRVTVCMPNARAVALRRQTHERVDHRRTGIALEKLHNLQELDVSGLISGSVETLEELLGWGSRVARRVCVLRLAMCAEFGEQSCRWLIASLDEGAMPRLAAVDVSCCGMSESAAIFFCLACRERGVRVRAVGAHWAGRALFAQDAAAVKLGHPSSRGFGASVPFFVRAAAAPGRSDAEWEHACTEMLAALQGHAHLHGSDGYSFAHALVERASSGPGSAALGRVLETLLQQQPCALVTGDCNGRTAVHHAVALGALDTLREVLRQGGVAAARARDHRDDTPLHGASTERQVRLLLQAGACLQARGAFGDTPLLRALRNRRAYAATIALLRAGSSLAVQDATCGSALHIIALNGRPGYEQHTWGRRIVGHLLDAAPPGTLDALDAAGETAVAIAVREGRRRLARQLLQAGADPFLHRWRGMAAVHYAVVHRDSALLALMLEGGHGSRERVKACRVGVGAAGGGRRETLLHVLANTAPPPDPGWVPVHPAAAWTSRELWIAEGPSIAAMLCAAGADPLAKDAFGDTPASVLDAQLRLQPEHAAHVQAILRVFATFGETAPGSAPS